MRRDLHHLFSAFIALLVLGGLLVEFQLYSQRVEAQYVHALAPKIIQQATQGEALPIAALQQPDLLPMYGSSELFNDIDRYGAVDFFQNHPTGFTVFEIAKAGIQSLILSQDLASDGAALRGKKVVISFTPDMFNYDEVNKMHYAGNFSRLHAYELAFSPYLSFDVKQMAAGRMLEYPDTLEKDPFLQAVLQNLACNCSNTRLIYTLTAPIGWLQTYIMRLQDHWEVLYYIYRHPKLKPDVARKNARIDWTSEINTALQEQELNTSSNPFGVENADWQQTVQNKFKKSIPPGSQDAEFIQSLDQSKEWTDMEIMLRVLKELGAQPLP